MGIGNKIRKVVAKFDPITLDKMDAVKLMRRTDTKYVVPKKELPKLLKKAMKDYFMVEIENEREQIYKTTYFDTIDYSMYQFHHNGKLNRHKIRVRKYIYSQQEFLEIKRKNNKGETIKNRIAHNAPKHMIQEDNSDIFLEKYSPYNKSLLFPALDNQFIRLTLVNKNFNERITIDYKLKFTDLRNNLKTKSKDIIIVEIKKSRENKTSPIINYFNKLRIPSLGFSKYCIGMALLNPQIKTNNFKQRIRAIAKV